MSQLSVQFLFEDKLSDFPLNVQRNYLSTYFKNNCYLTIHLIHNFKLKDIVHLYD